MKLKIRQHNNLLNENRGQNRGKGIIFIIDTELNNLLCNDDGLVILATMDGILEVTIIEK